MRVRGCSCFKGKVDDRGDFDDEWVYASKVAYGGGGCGPVCGAQRWVDTVEVYLWESNCGVYLCTRVYLWDARLCLRETGMRWRTRFLTLS